MAQMDLIHPWSWALVQFNPKEKLITHTRRTRVLDLRLGIAAIQLLKQTSCRCIRFKRPPRLVIRLIISTLHELQNTTEVHTYNFRCRAGNMKVVSLAPFRLLANENQVLSSIFLTNQKPVLFYPANHRSVFDWRAFKVEVKWQLKRFKKN